MYLLGSLAAELQRILVEAADCEGIGSAPGTQRKGHAAGLSAPDSRRNYIIGMGGNCLPEQCISAGIMALAPDHRMLQIKLTPKAQAILPQPFGR
ncbi:hypothetical protein D3C80_1697010 [compost metagenome]